MTDQNELPPPKGAPVDDATKAELTAMLAPIIANQNRHDDALTNIVMRLDERAQHRADEHERFMQRFDTLDGVKAQRDQEIAARPDRAEVGGLLRAAINDASDMLSRTIADALAPMDKRLARMEGSVDTALSNRNTDIQRLDRDHQIMRDGLEEIEKRVNQRIDTVVVRVEAQEQRNVAQDGEIADLQRDIHGDPKAPHTPSVMGQLEKLQQLIIQYNAQQMTEMARQEARHREEMTALKAQVEGLRTQVESQATMLDIILYVPRFVGGVVKNWTKGGDK